MRDDLPTFRAHNEQAMAHAAIAELEEALARAKSHDRTTVILIDTDPLVSTGAGGHWWDVAVPEVSARAAVTARRKAYEEALELQRMGD